MSRAVITISACVLTGLAAFSVTHLFTKRKPSESDRSERIPVLFI